MARRAPLQPAEDPTAALERAIAAKAGDLAAFAGEAETDHGACLCAARGRVAEAMDRAPRFPPSAGPFAERGTRWLNSSRRPRRTRRFGRGFRA